MTGGVAHDDAVLRRVERRAAVLTAGAALASFAVPGWGWPVAAGVAGGALLAGVSYWAIRSGVTGVTNAIVARPAAGAPWPRRARTAAMFVLRYALLAGMAYVMIARLRLPPVALFVGASVLVAAAVVEAVRRRR